MSNIINYLFLLFCLIVVVQNVFAQPTIVSFSPLNGAVGASVTLKGTGFNTIPLNNIVFFGATQAKVTTATDTSINVTVPTGATYSPISLLNTNTNLTGYSTRFFNPTYSPNMDRITGLDFAPKLDFAADNDPTISFSDIDGDGKPDLVTSNANSRTISVFLNTSSKGTVSFEPRLDFSTGSLPSTLCISDLDGDGKPDVAVINYATSTVSVFRNTGSIGTISFAPKVTITAVSLSTSMAIGDLDGDGKPDMAITSYSNSIVSVFRNTGNKGTISFAEKVDFQTDTTPRFIALGDLDGDRKLDIITSHANTNTVSALLNTSDSGSVNFATRVDYPLSLGPDDIVIGDLDGDDRLDLAVSHSDTYVSTNKVSVIKNTSSIGSISFSAELEYIVDQGPKSLAIGDIDGDGRPDLVTANSSSSNVSILRNKSSVDTIRFDSRINRTASPIPYSVAVCDIDGDGKPDIATGNRSLNTISVIRNYPKFPPKITVTGELTSFSSCANTASAPQTLTVSAIGLTTPLKIGLPQGFEVSTDSDSGFVSTLFLDPISGIVDSTKIYVRLFNWVIGSYSGNVVCSSTGATTQNISAIGEVKRTSSSLTFVSICQDAVPYVWNGRTYDSTTIDTVYLTNSVGCDSITVLNLTVHPPRLSLTNRVICSSVLPFIWNGRTYDTTTKDTVYLTSSVGCDSSAILNLTVNPTPVTGNIIGLANVTRLDTTSYSVSGADASSFNWIVTGATIQSGANSNQIKVLWTTVGSGEIKVTETSSEGCVATSKTKSVMVSSNVGLKESTTDAPIRVYPNPATKQLTITVDNQLIGSCFKIVDYWGRVLVTGIIQTNHEVLSIENLSSGIYLLCIGDDLNPLLKIIKQ